MRLTIVLAALIGAASVTLFASISIAQQNRGSCPDNYSPCDHTFPGTNVWIGATATEIKTLGFILLAGALGLGAYLALRRMIRNPQAKPIGTSKRSFWTVKKNNSDN